MGIFRRIKLKRMERKAKRATEHAEQANELAKETWQWTDWVAEKCEEIQRALDLIPWYRLFKRRSTQRRLKQAKIVYKQALEEVTIKDKEAQQVRKMAKNIKNLAEAELISQQLSDNPDDIHTIRKWLSKPPICYEASSLEEKKQSIPKTKGVYAWYFAHGELNVPSNSYFRVDDFELLYIGITGNLRRRIYSKHINGNADGSTLRFSLGILLRRKGSPLEPKRKGIKKRIEWSNEDYLTEWICDNALVAWIEHKHPKLVEEQAVKNFGCLLPLNIEHNKENLFAQDLKRERNQMRSEVLKQKKQ